MAVYGALHARLRTYPRMLWLLAVGCFLNIAGLSFIWPITSLYIHNELGRPMTVAGIVLMLHSGGASLGQLAGGFLYDRIGARPVMLAGLLGSTALIALPGLFSSWPLYVAVMALYGFTASLVFPPINALAARIWPEGGRRAFNFLYVANNLGVAAGTALGGVVADYSYRLAFLCASVTFLLFAAYVFLVIDERRTGGGQASETATGETAAAVQEGGPIPWVPIGALYAGFFVLWLIYVQWQATISVYIESVGISLSQYGALWTLNGLLIVLGQPLIAGLVRAVRGFAAQLSLGTVLYVIAFGLLFTSDRYAVFAAGMVVLTFGEMLLWPGIPAAVAELSPPRRRGMLQGIILSASTLGRMLGPLAGGVLFDRYGFRTLLTVMVIGLAVPLVSFLLYARTRRRVLSL